MAGKFVLRKGEGKSESYRFTLRAGNGQVVLTSESYASKSAAESGAKSVAKNCGNDKCYERKVAKDGRAYFVLKSTNGEVIGQSQMYKSNAAMEKGIRSVKANGGSVVSDQT